MKKSSSFNVLLSEGALQNRWRQNAGASFIRIRKNKFRSSFIYLILFIFILLVIYISVPANRHHYNFTSYKHLQQNPTQTNQLVNYNKKYPLTNPLTNVHEKAVTWKIGLIADLDTNSRTKRDNEFVSYIKRGWLTISSTHTSFDFKFDADAKEIISGYALKGKSHCHYLLHIIVKAFLFF